MPLIMRNGSLTKALLPTMRSTLFRKSSTQHKGVKKLSFGRISCQRNGNRVDSEISIKQIQSKAWGAKRSKIEISAVHIGFVNDSDLPTVFIKQKTARINCAAKFFVNLAGSSEKMRSLFLIGPLSGASRKTPPPIFTLTAPLYLWG